MTRENGSSQLRMVTDDVMRGLGLVQNFNLVGAQEIVLLSTFCNGDISKSIHLTLFLATSTTLLFSLSLSSLYSP